MLENGVLDVVNAEGDIEVGFTVLLAPIYPIPSYFCNLLQGRESSFLDI